MVIEEIARAIWKLQSHKEIPGKKDKFEPKKISERRCHRRRIQERATGISQVVLSNCFF